MEENHEASHFYRRVLRCLNEAEVPFLVGGGYGLSQHTGVERRSRDLDLFLRESDLPLATAAVGHHEWTTEVTHPHWLAKVKSAAGCADLIFSSGNGLAYVEDEWFAHATPFELLGVQVLLCPAEEMIWQKAFVMERERFDGADVLHLLLACGTELDWPRLLRRFRHHEEVLLAHLVLFRYVYPSFTATVPACAYAQLLARLVEPEDSADPGRGRPLCRGPFLSRSQYLVDIQNWGFLDVRLTPHGPMTADQVAAWTAAIEDAAPRSTVRGAGLPEANLHHRRGRV
ncbi:MAG: nucleotidyltransferase [Myxococcota bacterium]